VVRGHLSARLMIVSQAPGTKVHETGLSFNDRSGDVLRGWLASIGRPSTTRTASPSCRSLLLPAATGRRRPAAAQECAPLWQDRLSAAYPNIRLRILAGFLRHRLAPARPGRKATMTATVRAWREYLAESSSCCRIRAGAMSLGAQNPWFEAELVPELRPPGVAATERPALSSQRV